MSAQVNNWDITMDFFKANPVYLADPVFKEVKTKYKKDYSNILWFIALTNDPNNVKDKNLSKETKFNRYKYLLPIELLNKDTVYLNSLVKAYQELCETHPMKMLRIWKEKLDEKLQFMSENKYTVDEYIETEMPNGSVRQKLVKGTWEMLEALQAGNVKAYKEWEEINKQLTKENEGKSLGGEEKSLADKGGLI